MDKAKRRFRRPGRAITLASVSLMLSVSALPASATGTLKVCSDPNNLPFSNRRLEGFENRIAALIAKDLGKRVVYTWMPQRRNFFRRTLLAERCDVVMGVPSEFELVAPTEPYYRSTYAFVSQQARKLNITSFDDPVLKDLRIGLHAVGAEGANTPPAQALSKRGVVKHIVGYTMWAPGGVDNPPSRVIDDVAGKRLDLAIIWGPFAGYFAAKHKGLAVQPVMFAPDTAAAPYSYSISLGVRKNDEPLKKALQAVLDRRRNEIQKILNDFHIPLV